MSRHDFTTSAIFLSLIPVLVVIFYSSPTGGLPYYEPYRPPIVNNPQPRDQIRNPYFGTPSLWLNDDRTARRMSNELFTVREQNQLMSTSGYILNVINDTAYDLRDELRLTFNPLEARLSQLELDLATVIIPQMVATKKSLEVSGEEFMRLVSAVNGSAWEAECTYIREHYEHLMFTDRFYGLPVQFIVRILSHDEINVQSEEDIYRSVINWFQHDETAAAVATAAAAAGGPNPMMSMREGRTGSGSNSGPAAGIPNARMRYIPDILKLIRFEFMSPDFLTNVVMQDPIFAAYDPDQALIREAYRLSMIRFSPPEIGAGVGKDSKLSANYSISSRRPAGREVLILAGGTAADGTALREVELYDPRSDLWHMAEPMTDRREQFGLAVVKNIAYVIGGRDPSTEQSFRTVDRYDPVTNSWSIDHVPRMTYVRHAHGTAVLLDEIYIMGGTRQYVTSNNVQRYDPRTNLWAEIPPLQHSRTGLTAVGHNGHVYAIGGEAHFQPLTIVERYSPATNRWERTAQLTYARHSCAATSHEGIIFVAGGRGHGTDQGEIQRTVEMYDEVSNRWVPFRSRLLAGHIQLGLISLNGTLMAVGGHDQPESADSSRSSSANAMSHGGNSALIYDRRGSERSGGSGGGNGGSGGKPGKRIRISPLERLSSKLNEWTHGTPPHLGRVAGGVGVLKIPRTMFSSP